MSVTEPQVYLDTSVASTPSTGSTILVQGTDLQTALSAAHLGDTVVLAPGVTYTGNFVIPPLTGTAGQWLTITTAGSVPAEGTRMTAALAASCNLPKIVSNTVDPALHTADRQGTGYIRIVGVEFSGTPQGGGVDYCYKLIQLGDGFDTTLGELTHDVILDRCYIHGGSVSVQ